MGEEGDYNIYLSLHCHHQNDSYIIEMGSNESHFNVSLTGRDKSHKMVSTEHNV